jgi:hypothetical protein
MNTDDRGLEFEEEREIGETPELFAAIDEGMRSLETEPTYTLDEVRGKIAQRASKRLDADAGGRKPDVGMPEAS